MKVPSHIKFAMLAALLTVAVAAHAMHRPRPAVALVIIETSRPGGAAYSTYAVGFDLKSQYDPDRRVEVKSLADAEKMVALLQETAPGRYFIAGLVTQ
jgi:hypothetical protein